jgi:hypothetical protein
MNTKPTRIRDRPHTRIDGMLYAQVGQEAKSRGIQKTTMLEAVLQLGLTIYRLDLAYEPLVSRHVVMHSEAETLIRNKPHARLSAALYAEIGQEALQRKLHKTDLVELCVKIGLANLRVMAASVPVTSRVTPMRSRQVA